MYLPEHFRESRAEVLRELMERHPLATLITTSGKGIEANHIPLLYEASESGHGKLRGHLSRADNQWRDINEHTEALAIFQGPQAYITPNSYPTKAEHGRAVPTWNYAVVHVRGCIQVYDDPIRLRQFPEQLTDRHESSQPQPWSVKDAPDNYVDGRLRAIVGIEMDITGIEGKWKVSQNQPASNREGAARGLEAMATAIRNSE